MKNDEKYNTEHLFLLFAVWAIGKIIWKSAPVKLDVFFYMLLGIIGVFVWPSFFEKTRLKRLMGLLKRMGRISLELYLTNIYINSLVGKIGSLIDWVGIRDLYNVGRYLCVLIFGVLISVVIAKCRLKRGES